MFVHLGAKWLGIGTLLADQTCEKSEKKSTFVLEGVQPDITLLKIVRNDDNLQFNKINNLKDRSMPLVS